MTYVNIQWDYTEVESIISTVDHAGTRLKNVPTPRFPPPEAPTTPS